MTDIYIYILDIRISADASRRLQLKAAACQTFAVYQENHGDPCAAHAQKRDRHIYIYTHRESLVRKHEPCAKALGN